MMGKVQAMNSGLLLMKGACFIIAVLANQQANPWPGPTCHCLCLPLQNGLMKRDLCQKRTQSRVNRLDFVGAQGCYDGSTPQPRAGQLEDRLCLPLPCSPSPVLRARHQEIHLAPLLTLVLNFLVFLGEVGGNSEDLGNRFNKKYSPQVPKRCRL